MANGKCDICGRPATVRVRASVNGEVQNLQLCDQHYQETLRRQGRSASPLESLFGRRSLFDEFFGDSGMGSLFGDSPLRGGGFPGGGDISERWPGWSAQGSATDKWIVCRLFPGTADMGRHAGRATPHIGGQVHAATASGRLSKYV